jgi:hypothetical protein
MNWEERLREMVLAGGAFAVACGGSALVGAGDASSDVREDQSTASSSGSSGGTSSGGTSSGATSSGGTSSGGTSSGGGSSGSDASSLDASTDGPRFPFPCCNLVADPCCMYLNCGGALTPACSVELDCRAEGGTYTFYPTVGPDGGTVPAHCSYPGDAAPRD